MHRVLKGVALYSGGLDSILAIKLMLDQGCRVEALGFRTPFFDIKHNMPILEGYPEVSLKVLDITDRFLEVLASPRHGYGRHLNPCIDCKVLMLSEAKSYMEKVGADFVFTGEVLGQRPMSQRKDTLRLVEKEAGLAGTLLRPLSAKLLPPTRMEEEGWIDRQRLLDLSGRSRKRQISMAGAMNLSTYSTPGGGCLLTDPSFVNRLRPLMDKGALYPEMIRWLRIGRHFELPAGPRVVVGRNHEENELILNMAGQDDILLKTLDIPGPVAAIIGRQTHMPLCDATNHENNILFSEQPPMPLQGATKDEKLELFSEQTHMPLCDATNHENNILFSEQSMETTRLAASIMASYSDFQTGSEVVVALGKKGEFAEEIRVSPMSRNDIEVYRV